MRLNTVNPKRELSPLLKGILYILATIILVVLLTGGIIYLNENRDKSENSKSTKSSTSSEVVANQNELCIDSNIPNQLKNLTETFAKENSLKISETNNIAVNCEINLLRNSGNPEEYKPAYRNLFVVVTRFDNPIFEIQNFEELEALIMSKSFSENEVIWDTETSRFLQSKFQNAPAQFYTSNGVLERLKENPQTVAIIPYNQLEVGIKYLEIDGENPLAKKVNLSKYPLSDTYWVTKDSELADDLIAEIETSNSITKFQPDKIKDLMLTGNSAIGSRNQDAVARENNDSMFVSVNIEDILNSADILHINQTASFTESCKQTAFSQTLCGDMNAYNNVLLALKPELISVSGSNILDYNSATFRDTLTLAYTKNEISYFGGGIARDDAHEAAVLSFDEKFIPRKSSPKPQTEVPTTTEATTDEGATLEEATPETATPAETEATTPKEVDFAFLGYSIVPPFTYRAFGQSPGNTSIEQNYGDFKYLQEDLELMKSSYNPSEVYVQFTWGSQDTHFDNVYQRIYGQGAINLGADFVIGNGTNYVQGIEFYKDGVIFYGLGQLFLDQGFTNESKQAIIVRQIYYDKKYLGFEIIPITLGDPLQPALASKEEKTKILNTIYENSRFTQ